MNNNELLSEKDSIIEQISKLQKEADEKNIQIAQAKSTEQVREYLSLIEENKQLMCRMDLLRAQLVTRCEHIRVIWKEDNNGKIKFHITCAASCGYKEDSIDYKNASYEGKLQGSIVPHIFNSYEEASDIYKQAIQLVPTNDKMDIIKKMAELAKVPMAKEPKRQKVLVPRSKPIPTSS